MRIDVASPCKREWSKMSGDDKVRACGDCKLSVYNLSAMTEAEVAELVKQREGRLCVRFYARPDGTVLTRDCPVGVGRKRRTYAASLGAVAALLTAPLFGASSCPTDGSPLGELRALVFELKVKLGLATRPVVMGEWK